MNKRQEMFCREYVIDWNASRAARAAGYSRESAPARGCELSQDPECMAFIAELTMGLHKKAALTAENLLDFYNRAVSVDRTGLVDEDGRHKGLHELDADLAGIVEGYKITDKGVEVKLVSRLQAARDVGEHLGTFKRIVELHHSGGVAVAAVKVDADDPNEAAEQYQRLMRGG